MVKFRIGFTITPEVLFGIIGKVLPLEDMHIEQVVETPAPDPKWHPDPAIRFDKKFDLPKPTKSKKHKRNPSIPIDLTKGVNKTIMDLLKNGPHKAIEMRAALRKTTSYSPNSIGSRLQSLERNGVVVRMGDGKWCLAKSYITPEMRKVVEEYHNGDEVE